MSTINDGGLAFPIPDVPYPNGNVQHGWNGMTLRDWFAGQALVGLVGRAETNDGLAIAKDAYVIADAMLRAREAKP